MMITKYYRFKIIEDVCNGLNRDTIIKKYSNINLTTTEFNIIINKSSKCRVRENNGVLERKCIYCENFKEVNEENFTRDSSRKGGFNTLCKIHFRIKQRNYRIINIKEYRIKHNEESKRYYHNHKEERQEYRKEYYKKNKVAVNRKRTINKRKQTAKRLKEKLAAARENILITK